MIMTIYDKWIAQTEIPREHDESESYWAEYFSTEKDFYKELLGNYTKPIEGTFSEIADHFNKPHELFMGFLDGINTSLKSELDLKKIKENTKIAFGC